LALLWRRFGGKDVTNKKNLPPSFVMLMFPTHRGASSFGSYCRHRSSSAQTKGVDLIYGLLVMPPALGLVEFFGGTSGKY